MLTDKDLVKIQEAGARITGPVKIAVNRAGIDTPFEANLAAIASQISGVTMNRIEVEEGDGFLFPGKPSLTLSDGTTRNIHYMAAPEGRELDPFLDALLWLGQGRALPKSAAIDLLPEVSDPAGILVLMSALCPHCPQAVSAALSLAVSRPWITVGIVDAVEFPDLADRYKVKSTPTTIVNEEFTKIGRVDIEELARYLSGPSGNEALTLVLDSMIKSGRAEDAAVLICREKCPLALLPIYKSPEFSTRIGALLTMEEALAKDPKILDPIVGELIGLLSADEVSLRGDTAELLGKIGNPAALPALRQAAQDPDPDVREAAQEALESLE